MASKAARRLPFSSLIDKGMGSIRTFGRTMQLGVEAFWFMITDIVRLRFSWRELILQSSFMSSVTAIPAVLVAIPFGVIISVQVGSLTSQIGASSFSGAASGLGILRQAAPIVAALLMGGAAGSAIAADLGARTIREEIDAMKTMGINPIQRVVAPRLLAMIIVAPLVCALIIFVGIASGYVINVSFQGGSAGSYISSFGQFATTTDLWIALGKSVLFGVIVTIVACQRGLEARGGPRGVADSVNASVVIGVLACFLTNLVITQIVTLFLPSKVG